jgi:undecaprenol kinase/diacylglycerol kinase (ATP)
MRYVIGTQRNAKIHLIITVMVLALALWLRVSASEWAILSLTVAVVLAAEMMNTSVEAVVNLLSPEFHPLAKIAKDTAAGAVFTLALGAVVVGIFILGPPLLAWVGESLVPKIFAWL